MRKSFLKGCAHHPPAQPRPDLSSFREQAYRNHGFGLANALAGTVEERVEIIDRYTQSWAE